jgi:transcriptional regulator with XRE-family HTH domain
MDLFELGEAFRHARIAASRTQREIEALSGVSRARISRFETGSLPELGTAKLLRLFQAVGLEIIARPIGHQCTFDDVLLEPQAPAESDVPQRIRVRRPKSGGKPKQD